MYVLHKHTHILLIAQAHTDDVDVVCKYVSSTEPFCSKYSNSQLNLDVLLIRIRFLYFVQHSKIAESECECEYNKFCGLHEIALSNCFLYLAQTRSVRFNNLSEVRQLSDSLAEDAKLARLSWSAYMRAEESKLKSASRLTVKQVLKAAVVFCVVVSIHWRRCRLLLMGFRFTIALVNLSSCAMCSFRQTVQRIVCFP